MSQGRLRRWIKRSPLFWKSLRADDPFRDYARDSELRLVIGKKLLDLAADGETDPVRLCKLTVESLLFPHH